MVIKGCRNQLQARTRSWWRGAGLLSFAFFVVKGIVWLLVPLILYIVT